ncbi:T9SS type A sorting domain-containing protein, partial [candidate division KSB1 bacterium]|nr:T9SS type A sorting domain-containing protein [candidate division KSB1 bacterium]
ISFEDNINRAGLPTIFHLSQNYPNPFNATTCLYFRVNFVNQPGEARVAIFNLLGASVTEMVLPLTTAGNYRITWDGLDRRLQPVPSGIYIFRLQIGATRWQKKMLLLR